MSAYLSAVIADAPVHYWRFADPGGGLAHDIGSSPYHLGTGLLFSLGYGGPVSDGGSFFVTGGSFAQSLGSIQSITSPFSAEWWFWPTGPNTANAFMLQWDGVGAPEMQALYLANLTVQGSVNAAFTNPVTTYAVQRWHHVVITYDGATVRLYVDSVNSGLAALAGPVTIHKPIGIGATPPAGGNAFSGFISEFAIYGTALSATRVGVHFNAANQTNQAPVYSNAGGIGGSGGSVTSPDYTSVLQQILQSVRKIFPTT